MLPTIFIPHGGGPCFFMDWTAGPADTWDELAECLKSLHTHVGETPKAILLISAHWEEDEVTVQATVKPGLIYDYYNFPAHTYELKYPAAGSPELAERVVELLGISGIHCNRDKHRGFDHGVFIPMLLSYPAANVPIVQLSLKNGLDPSEHIEIGKALTPLRDEGVLIIGSGLSFHNLALLNSWNHKDESIEFDEWLTATCCEEESQRTMRLHDWEKAPNARLAHPREEHLIPLMVIAGAAGKDRGSNIFCGDIHDLRTSGYKFG